MVYGIGEIGKAAIAPSPSRSVGNQKECSRISCLLIRLAL